MSAFRQLVQPEYFINNFEKTIKSEAKYGGCRIADKKILKKLIYLVKKYG
jgi:hypothetical protein